MNDHDFIKLQDATCDLLKKFGVPNYTEHEKSDKMLSKIHDIRNRLANDIDQLIEENNYE